MEQNIGFSLCLRGHSEVLAGGRVYPIEPGTLLLKIPVYSYVELSRSDDYEECGTEAEVEQMQPLLAQYTSQFVAENSQFSFAIGLDEEQRSHFVQAIGNVTPRPGEAPVHLRPLAETIALRQRQNLVMEAVLILLQQPGNGWQPGRQEKLFVDFMLALAQNYVQHRDVAWYADRAHLTARHFSHSIRSHSGHTPMEWIIIVTIAHAKRLLSQPGVQVKEVANQLGFPEQFTFRKYFKQHTGMSPSEYQKKDKQ